MNARHEVRNIDVSMRVRALEAAQRAQRDGLGDFARGLVDFAELVQPAQIKSRPLPFCQGTENKTRAPLAKQANNQ
jgi:hypothetical protein